MTFAEKIRQLRKEKGLSQTQLAQAVGVSLRTVRGWEIEGRNPKQRDIYSQLANVLGCDVSYLMTEKENLIADAAENYGSRGVKDANEIIESVDALFSSGKISEEDMDAMMLAMHDVYMEAKRRSKKYTPKRYRNEDSDE